MRKIFPAILFALVLAATASAQTSIVHVSVTDPTDVTVVNNTELISYSNSNSIAYILNVPSQMSFLSLQFSATIHTDIIGVNAVCSASQSESDPPMFNGNGRTIQIIEYTPSFPFPQFTSFPAVPLTANQESQLIVPVLGCARLGLLFSTASGTTSDTLTVKGNFVNSSRLVSTPGGIPISILGGLDANGFFNPAKSSVLGNIVVDPFIFSYAHVTGTAATEIFTFADNKTLHTVTINTGAAGTLKIFDLASAACTGTPSTNIIASITVTAGTLQTLTYDANMSAGLCVQASAAMDVTISYK